MSYSDRVTATNATTYALYGSLPPGLNFNNGLISGTPQQNNSQTEMQDYTFSITASGASGTTPVTQSFTIPLRFPGRVFTNNIGGSDNPRIARRLNESLQWEAIQSVKKYNGSVWEVVDLN